MIPLKIRLPASFLEDEPREIVVSAGTKRVWAVELDLLCEFDRVCRKRRLRYVIDAGTLLGAVRHKGFVPWDNDIDVSMARPEYDKLLAAARDDFVHPYFLQTDVNSREAARGHAQLRNSETTAVLACESKDGKSLFSFNQGIFIDIFPLDNLPDDDAEKDAFLRKLAKIKDRVGKYREALMVLRGRRGRWFSPHTVRYFLLGLRLALSRRLLAHDPLEDAVASLERACRAYNGVETRRCAAINFLPRRRDGNFHLNSDLRDTVMVPFENFRFPAPRDYERVLSGAYGNWRRHVVGGAEHGGVIFDVDRSYREYLG